MKSEWSYLPGASRDSSGFNSRAFCRAKISMGSSTSCSFSKIFLLNSRPRTAYISIRGSLVAGAFFSCFVSDAPGAPPAFWFVFFICSKNTRWENPAKTAGFAEIGKFHSTRGIGRACGAAVVWVPLSRLRFFQTVVSAVCPSSPPRFTRERGVITEPSWG